LLNLNKNKQLYTEFFIIIIVIIFIYNIKHKYRNIKIIEKLNSSAIYEYYLLELKSIYFW